MTNWLLRGVAFAAAMVGLRLVQGALINTFESQSALISLTLVIIFVAGVVLWGLFDGRADATANPDPDRRKDLATVWLVAGLGAGVLAGAVTWLVGLFDKAVYVGGLINELTTFAAFTALLVFVPAMIGVVIGRFLVDRRYAKMPVRHHGLALQDTDVFAAVGAGGESTVPVPGAPASGEETTVNIPTEGNPADSNG